MRKLVENIIKSHAKVKKVKVGDIVSVDVDKIYLQDGNSPTIKLLFNQHNFTKVFDKEKIGVFFDHSVLSTGIEISNRLKEAHEFSKNLGLQIFNAGVGISHVVAVEKGWFKPGNIVIATDSHTCTGGLVQSLALGMGATDVVAAMLTGKTWLKVPETIWLEIKGTPSQYASAKDVMLYILSHFDEKRFLYKSVEWCGKWFESLSHDSAATIANMGVEMGAKCVFLPPWKNTPVEMQPILPDRNSSNYVSIDITDLPPFVALPNSPSNAVPINECEGQMINYVFVGSCANSRLEDIAIVAQVLKKHPLSKDCKFVVTPGSQEIYLQAMAQGYIQTIIGQGGLVTPPGCGTCVGTQGHIPADNDNILSTMNRNFLGRMGNPRARIWLSSPLIAAYTGVMGKIPSIKEIKSLE